MKKEAFWPKYVWLCQEGMYIRHELNFNLCLRPYHVGSSRPITEVKQRRARLALRMGDRLGLSKTGQIPFCQPNSFFCHANIIDISHIIPTTK